MDGNLFVLDGSQQTVLLPLQARVSGTRAAETLQVPARGDISFGGNTGDRVEFARDADAYDFSAGGNVLTVSRPDGASAEIALNADVELAFADGSTTAGIDAGSGTPSVQVDGRAVDSGFDPSTVNLDGTDISGIADTGSGGTSTSDGSDDGGATAGAELEATFTDPAGVFDGVRPELRDSLQAAWVQWTDELAIDTDVTIEAEIISDPDLPDSTLAQALSGTTVDTGLVDDAGQPVHQQGVVAELKTGTDPNGIGEDLRIEIPEVDDWVFNTELSEDVPRTQFDALTILTHELGHVLGFNGTHTSNVGRVSTFDTNVESDPFGGLVFDGASAREANGGDTVPLADGDPYHLADDGDLMATALRAGESRDISDVDLAMLADAGVPLAGETVEVA
ncbi:hypothetical protein SAMN05216241_11056 [Limimonas halophila]|uniref:Matrixin n=1 Tax=Limimonas halophila TaxID=1082479 RepID=A0A1G7TSH2_9PROT|nr:hypothetical protein [Limimonas halophila]SDG38188.1 hypothetical protein SAMN05216241_11056 [Limimonas halophila]